jgi:hypothetical protein
VLPSAAAIWIAPEYFPAERLAGITETVIIPGAVPVAGVSVSQEPPEVVAVNASEPLLGVRVNFCNVGSVPPDW